MSGTGSKNTFTIANNTREEIPRVLLEKIKNEALGGDYELTLVFTDSESIRKLNKQYRDKNAPTDILSFPLEENVGEIYICPEEARREAVKFDRPYENFLPFLFIHGLVHLKGHDHGATMESIEQQLREKFEI